MEWEISHPLEVLCLGSDADKERIMAMPEHERTALLDSVVSSGIHAQNCFLAAIMGYDRFFDDVEKDEAARRRGWGWND